ncbi:MAG: hypothetical protein U9Q61_05215 [Thermodesulfobacteriota bacterium]|nr:hypothetical protein [Thermodesulfobacteriota bacterium]
MGGLDSFLKTGAEAAMMMGANTRDDVYRGIDRVNKQIDLNAVSDILANSDIDFDNPATFAPVMQQLDQITPGLGAEMGQKLYAISNERMKAAAEASMKLSHGQAYQGQANESNANALRTNWGTSTLNKGVEAGSITPYAGARTAYGISGDASTPEEIAARERSSANIESDWRNYDSDADARARVEAARIKANADADAKGDGSPQSSTGFAQMDEDTWKEVFTMGVPMLGQIFPEVELRNPDGSVDEQAAMALKDAYRIGVQLAKANPQSGIRSRADVIRLGLDHLIEKGQLGRREITIKGKEGRIWDDPDTKGWGIAYPYGGSSPAAGQPQTGGQPPTGGAASVHEQPVNSQVPDYLKQQTGPSLQAMSQPTQSAPDPGVKARDEEKIIQSIIDETRDLYNDMFERRISKEDGPGLGDRLLKDTTTSNILEKGAKSGLEWIFNAPGKISDAFTSQPPSFSEQLESQARQAIDPRDTPEQIIIKSITYKLRAQGYNQAEIKQLVPKILQEVRRKPYNGFQQNR